MWLVMLDAAVSVCRSRPENAGCLEYKIRPPWQKQYLVGRGIDSGSERTEKYLSETEGKTSSVDKIFN